MQSTMARAKWPPLNREEEEVHLVAEFSNISHMTYGGTKQLGGDASSLISTFDYYFSGTKSGLASLVRGGVCCNVVFAVMWRLLHKSTPVTKDVCTETTVRGFNGSTRWDSCACQTCIPGRHCIGEFGGRLVVILLEAAAIFVYFAMSHMRTVES